MTTTKTKTFAQQSELHEIVEWVMNNIETEEVEIVSTDTQEYLDVKVETLKKYTITIRQK